MTRERSRRIVVVDPFPLSRRALVGLLRDRDGGQVVGEAGSRQEALEECALRLPDVVITDIDLLGPADGIRLCEQVKRLAVPPLVLVYSGTAAPGALAECLTHGADSFVHRTAPVERLISAIDLLFEGKPLWYFGELTPGTHTATLPCETVNGLLTPREQQILGLLLRRHSNEEIAEDLHLARQTVKNYVSNILQKLGVSSRRELLTGKIPTQPAARAPLPGRARDLVATRSERGGNRP
ncbi:MULTISPECIES: response regulator transcription factor [Streptomyces]|nr:response regulator transcription factor [Streptomyces sp. SCSIO ZS0520]